jgi:hypothetical protein
MQAGWLDDLTNWMRDQVERVWNAFVEFIGDAIVQLFATLLDLCATLIEAIPVPDFIANYSLGQFFSALPPEILWGVGQFNIGEAFAMIGAGYAFRLLRKLFTLGQW